MKATIFKITAIMLLLAVAITGCDRNPVEIPECECDIIIECYADDDAYKAVDSEINIILVERIGVYPRTMQMGFSTTRMYPSTGYRIDLSWQKSSNTIDIIFKSVTNPAGAGFAVMTPALATIDFGTLSNGTYQLNFRNGEIRCSGKLIVSANSYTIIFPENSAFNIRNSPLNKIPEGTIWGLVGYHREEGLPLIQSFFTALMEFGATKRAFTPGYYTGFRINENGDIIPPPNHIWTPQSFIFHFAGDTSDLDEFLKQWIHKYGEYMWVTINTYRGEQFLGRDLT